MQEIDLAGTLSTVTLVFTLALALALLVERFLEVLKAVYDMLESRLDWHRFWTGRAKALATKLDRKVRTLTFVKPAHVDAVLQRVSERLTGETTVGAGGVPVVDGNLVRAAGLRLALKLIAIAGGIGLAFWLEVNLVTYWTETGAAGPTAPGWQVAATGVIIGLGSGPVHKVIRAIEERQKRRRAERGAA